MSALTDVNNAAFIAVDDLVTAAGKHSLGDDWEELEHPRGADGKFIKKGTHEYFEAVDAIKKAKAAAQKPHQVKKALPKLAKSSASKKSLTGDPLMDALIDQEGLKKASQPKSKAHLIKAKPIKINTNVIYKQEYADGAVVAEHPGTNGQPRRLVWDAGSKKFKLQVQANGTWFTTNDFGKGAAYQEFKDQTGWTTPAMAQQEAADKIVAQHDASKIVISEVTEALPVDLAVDVTGIEKMSKIGFNEWFDENFAAWGTTAATKRWNGLPISVRASIITKATLDKNAFALNNIKIYNANVTPEFDPVVFNPQNITELSENDAAAYFSALTPEMYGGFNTEDKIALTDFAENEEGVGNPVPKQQLLKAKNQYLAQKLAADAAKVQIGQIVDPDDVGSLIVVKPDVDIPALMAMPAPSFNFWFTGNFLDDADQGLAKWQTLNVTEQAALTDKAELIQKLGYPNPLTVIKHSYSAGPPQFTDDPKISYPDFDVMDIVSTNVWFANLTNEQYDNFEEWEQEGIWDQAKEADEDFGNPKPLELLQSLTGMLKMGKKTSLPDFASMSTGQKLAWFVKVTQADYDQYDSDEVVKVVTEAAKLNAAGIDGPFKQISNFSSNAGSSGFATPDFEITEDLNTMTKAAFQLHILDNASVLQPPNVPSDEVWEVAAKYNLVPWLESVVNQKSPFNTTKSPDKMNAGEFMTFINGLGPITTPSDMYWNTAEKLGITPWAEQHTGLLSPHHDVPTLAPVTAPLVVKGMPVNTAPVPDKLDLTGLPSGPDAWQAAHTYAVAKVPAANTIGTPLADEDDFGELTKTSAKALQDHMLKWGGKKWTPAQISAVQFYTTSPGYQSMNAVLRNDQKRMKLFNNPQLANAAQQAIEVQSAMTPLTSSVLLHRGTGAQAFGFNTKSIDTSKLKALEGKVIKERGFMSTSVVSPKGEVGFDYANKPIKVIIQAPKGTPALYVTSATPSWDKENEMIIGAGSNFRIDIVTDATEADKKLYGDGIKQIVIMTVVPDEGTPTDEIHAGDKVKTPIGTKVTPAPIVKPPTPPVVTVVPNVDPIAPPLVPIKLNTKTIHSTAYEPNAIVAIRKTFDGTTQRLVWSASMKKFALQSALSDGTWKNSGWYTKKDAYAAFKNDTNWFAPPATNAVAGPSTTIDVINGLLGVGPNTSASPNPAPVVSVPVAKTKKTPPKTVDEIIGDYGTLPPNINEAAQQSIYTKFKTTSGFGTMMLGKPAETIFKALAAATAQWKHDNTNASLNHLQVLKLVDKIAASKSASGVNNGLYEEKILEWLQTSVGKKKAPDIIQLAEAAAKSPPPSAASSSASPAQILAQLTPAYDIGKPLELDEDAYASPVNFPNMAPAQASAMNTSMRKKYPITADQVNAIKNYTGSGSTAINNMLRYPTKQNYTVYTANSAQLIQSAMYPLPKSITVHRGSDNLGNSITGSMSITELQNLVGKTFSDGSFFSTSVGNSAAFSSKKFVMQIEVPEGTPGLYAKPISTHKSENELILAAGLHYKILGIVKVGYHYEVRVRVVNQ